jgi:hypothetical protein
VRNARRARGWHKRCPCADTWRLHLKALNVKGEACSRNYRLQISSWLWPKLQEVEEASSHYQNRQKKEVTITPPLLSIPNIVDPHEIATSPIEKAEALKVQSFPPVPDANLSDIPKASYPPEMSSSILISEEESFSILKKFHSFNVMAYHFSVLKYLGSPFVSSLKFVF